MHTINPLLQPRISCVDGREGEGKVDIEYMLRGDLSIVKYNIVKRHIQQINYVKGKGSHTSVR